MESGQQFQVRGRSFINATGPFCDAVRKLDQANAEPVIAPSQGVHVVLDRSFLPGKTAVIVRRPAMARYLYDPVCDHVLVERRIPDTEG